MPDPIECCAGCHFLVKEFRTLPAAVGTMTDYLEPEERDRARRDDFGWLAPPREYVLTCKHGVWEPGFHHPREPWGVLLARIERRDRCFYLPFDRNMLMPAAVTLQERRQAHREAERDRELTRHALQQTRVSIWVAVAALALSLALQVWQGVKAWPFGERQPAVAHGEVATPPALPSSATSTPAESVK